MDTAHPARCHSPLAVGLLPQKIPGIVINRSSDVTSLVLPLLSPDWDWTLQQANEAEHVFEPEEIPDQIEMTQDINHRALA